MNYNGISECDVLNGTGFRVVLFVSGCENFCRGCHNQKTWDYNFGHEFTDITEEYLYQCLDKEYIDGISISGGDPFAPNNRDTIIELIHRIRNRYGNTKDIWLWTGYTLSQLQEMNIDINDIDVIVDGRFEIDKRDVSLKFRGSSNQHIWRKVNEVWMTQE